MKFRVSLCETCYKRYVKDSIRNNIKQFVQRPNDIIKERHCSNCKINIGLFLDVNSSKHWIPGNAIQGSSRENGNYSSEREREEQDRPEESIGHNS